MSRDVYYPLTLSLALAALVGCSGDGVSDAGDPDPGAEATASILAVYYGLDELPPAANLLCPGPVAGQDGVPVTFSVRLDGVSVVP